MDTSYDYIIVGGGPTGLTLATYLPGKIAVIERHPVLGGCHRVVPNEKFVEHGPRVYSGAYVHVQRVLRDIGTSWDDVFEKTYFSPEFIDGKHWYQWLSVKEIMWLTFEYLVYTFSSQHGRAISMETYCTQKGFSASSKKYLDLVCRFSDGAGADRYSLWEFLSGFDQHILPFYAPRKPLSGLFEHWETVLKNRGVDVMTSTNVTKVTKESVVLDSGDTLRAKKIILCVPLTHAARFIPRLKSYAIKTKYDPYWSISFFGVDLPKGQRTTPWGIIAMKYPFGVVSAAASVFDVASPVTGKTLKDSSETEAAEEIRRQLFGDQKPEYSYLTTKYNDQSFFATAGQGYLDAYLEEGIDIVGCHNGNSSYHFTSMESAVQNAWAYLDKDPLFVWHMSDYIRIMKIVLVGIFITKLY